MQLQRTLGDVRADIQIRLGFGAAGQSGVVNSALIDSMIKSAQEQLYMQFNWDSLKSFQERITGANQQFYDYPNDCNIERIIGIWCLYGGQYFELKEGINTSLRNATSGGVPTRYNRQDQIEIWPVPSDNSFTLRIEYIRQLTPLVNNSDRLSLPSEMIFLHALANAKLHYRQPDAQVYSSQLDALMNKLKAANRKTVFEKEKVIDPFAQVTADQAVL